MERQRFDDSWKEAFEDAEMSPSDNLWTNIELDLEKAEGKKMKKRILYFKLMAAASVAFAMTFAAAGFFYMNYQQKNLTANISVTNDSSKQKTELGDANERNADDENFNNEQTADRTVETNNGQSSPNAAAKERVTDTPESQALASNAEQRKVATKPSSNVEHHGRGDSEKTIGISKKSENSRREVENTLMAENSSTISNSKNSSDTKNVTTTQNLAAVDPASNNQQQSTIQDRMFESANEIASLNSKINAEQQAIDAAAIKPPDGDERMITAQKLPEIVHLRAPAYQPEQNNVDPVKQMLERLEAEERKYASNKEAKEDKRSKKGKEQVWTSLGFAAGSFNTVVTGTNTAAMNSNFIQPQSMGYSDATYSISDNIVREQSKASGMSYAIGLSLGGKLSERWVLQGGLNYMTQTSDYTANAVVGSFPDRTNQQFNSPINYTDFKLGSIEEISNAGKNASLVSTASYNVNSNLQYLSVPLQAGYLIVNRDFGLQLNAGVSTDLFLQNTLTPEGGSLEATKQAAGDESPYRTVNFSGLVGTELSYRFGQHYRIALNPGIRYPFSSIYKSEIAVDAMPLTFDVGLRFRYIFN